MKAAASHADMQTRQKLWTKNPEIRGLVADRTVEGLGCLASPGCNRVESLTFQLAGIS